MHVKCKSRIVHGNSAAYIQQMPIVANDQTHRIRMAFANGSCKLSVQTPDLGEAQELSLIHI